jgi:very-short-patch-repair endonuclease
MKQKAQFTRAHLEKLKKEGKIRGHSPIEKAKPLQTLDGRIVSRHFTARSEGKNFIGWNLLYWCNQQAVTLFEEFKFLPDRKFRFDWAIPSLKIAIEFEGLDHNASRGGHTSFKDFNKDVNKYNLATANGWTLYRFTSQNYKTLLDTLNNHINRNENRTNTV